MRLGKEFAPQRALVYVDHLIARGELPEAKQVWDDLVRLRVIPPPAGREELLYNPDLRAPILNGGFDWRVPRHPQVSVTLGPGRAAPALVIRFTGEDNVHFQHFFQYVLVSPNTRYRFAAWMSTEGISSDSGPRLEVIQVDDRQQPPAYSPQLVGTNDWRPLEVEFTTSPRTRLLRVAVVRPPGRRGRSPIRGTVQAAEFSLRPVETPAR
ncbi:MAG: hypothetical protein HYY26_02305 [Acidobacteria bacterium]|nr:hypothetical protein [Acidobacteriota bacterium]